MLRTAALLISLAASASAILAPREMAPDFKATAVVGEVAAGVVAGFAALLD